jgi:phosphate-selective porin OprO and OprP
MKAPVLSALLCGAAMVLATPAWAQEATATVPSPAAEDEQAKIERLEQQVQALQKSLDEIKGAMVKATPSWKGAPQYEDKEAGWSFKPRGRLMFDSGVVDGPAGLKN